MAASNQVRNLWITGDAGSSPERSSLPPEDATLQLPVNYNFAHPAFFTAPVWDRTRGILHTKGHRTAAPELPASNKQATFEDDTDAFMLGVLDLAKQKAGQDMDLEQAVDYVDRLHFVGESRSVDPVLRARQRFIDAGLSHKILRTTIFCSAGPYDFTIEPDLPRYRPEYESMLATIKPNPEGLREIPPEHVIKFFLNDITDTSDKRIAEALACLQPQRDPQPDEPSFHEVTETDKSPICLALGEYDLVHYLMRQMLIAKKYGFDTRTIPTGHLPQVSQPELTANFLEELTIVTLLNKARNKDN